jgi:hypothetical protein
MFPHARIQEGYISEVVEISDSLDLIGFMLNTDVEFVVAFSAEDLADDLEFARSMALRHVRFHAGHELETNARTIKFSRSNASPDAPFRSVPLPRGASIWKFQRLLTCSIVSYVQARPDIRQFYFIPENESLDRWYIRLCSVFCRPGGPFGSGVEALRIASPLPNEGGFYGYQRL